MRGHSCAPRRGDGTQQGWLGSGKRLTSGLSQGPCQVELMVGLEAGTLFQRGGLCLSLLVLPGIPALSGVGGSYTRGTACSHGAWARGGAEGHQGLGAAFQAHAAHHTHRHTGAPTTLLAVSVPLLGNRVFVDGIGNTERRSSWIWGGPEILKVVSLQEWGEGAEPQRRLE